MAVQTAQDHDAELRNFKACLQELAQSKGMSQPIYITVATEGPEHAKTFTIEAQIGLDLREQGSGVTKKAAGQMAARNLFRRMSASA